MISAFEAVAEAIQLFITWLMFVGITFNNSHIGKYGKGYQVKFLFRVCVINLATLFILNGRGGQRCSFP